MTSGLATATLVRIGEITNRTYVLPLLVFFPTSRCNSRCVSCDWWKASGEGDHRPDEIARVAADLAEHGTRVVLFSGGEPQVDDEAGDRTAGVRGDRLTVPGHGHSRAERDDGGVDGYDAPADGHA